MGQDGPVISVYSFDFKGSHCIDDPEEISELIRRKGTVVWADFTDPTDEDLKRMQEEFSLHPLAIEDVSKKGQRPKLEVFDDHTFLVAYASCTDNVSLSEVDIFVGRNWLVTIHEHDQQTGAHFDIAAVRERSERTSPKKTTVAFLLYTVLDEIVDTYFGAVDAIGEEIDAIEERIFAEADPEVDERPTQKEMLYVRKKLLNFRRKVVPLREVLLMILRDDLAFMGPNSHHYFQDIFDHVMRITDEIDNERELIGNAVDAHLAMVSNVMNQTMKKMTSWGAILIVSTLITGIFGMNFQDMDLLNQRWGFRGVLLFMAAATLGMYAYFKRKNWI